jgi:Zn-dependent peptidase ImmA (M78 family)/transcriptional regulator with XRE-family HTH domain
MKTFNPEMLVIARESRGMTQKRLAELTGITQGTISKIENGQLEPSSEHLSAMARVLRFPENIFALQATNSLPVTFFRKQQALPATAAKIIRAAVALHKIRVEQLARSVELPENRVPSVTLSQKGGRSPSDVARELRIAWRIPHGPIVNLTELLEDNGIIVIPVDFGVDEIFGLSIYEPRAGLPPMMFVSKTAPGDRLRFTVAHELAHMILHHHCPLPPEECEDEANEFAAELLVPAAEVKSQITTRLSLRELVQLKMHWRVSIQCLITRAQSVGRITDSHASRLWRQISAMGYRKQEPVEIPREQPNLLTELVRVHLEDLSYSQEQLSATLYMTPPDFLDEYGSRGRGLRLVHRAPSANSPT